MGDCSCWLWCGLVWGLVCSACGSVPLFWGVGVVFLGFAALFGGLTWFRFAFLRCFVCLCVFGGLVNAFGMVSWCDFVVCAWRLM